MSPVKRSFVKATTVMAGLLVRIYLPPGFDPRTLATMLTVVLGTIWTAARTLKEFQ